jgi:NAD(P)-dependent dehydrogenase (short-subunit alcohol dehydrogenase family)
VTCNPAQRQIRNGAYPRRVLGTPGTKEALAGSSPLNRVGEVADIVRAVLFLEDTRFVTREILHVDGGMIVATNNWDADSDRRGPLLAF